MEKTLLQRKTDYIDARNAAEQWKIEWKMMERAREYAKRQLKKTEQKVFV